MECIVNYKRPSLLVDNEDIDSISLIDKVKNNMYSALDEDTPVCRFRGTWIKRTNGEFEIVGWQRNVSRLQKMDVSLPTILHLHLNSDLVIKSIVLDKCFAGSKGLLCYREYLNNNVKEKLIGKQISDTFFMEIQVKELHCFHITEVMGGIISSLQIMDEKNLDFIYEEEVTDSYRSGDDLIASGMQKFSHIEKPIYYSMVFNNALNSVKFKEDGTIFTEGSFNSTFYLNDKEVAIDNVSGNNERKFCTKVKTFSQSGVNNLKKVFTSDMGNSFMCSNLSPQAFIGLFIQSLAMKIFNNNYNYVLHCLKGIQRYANVPRCIGAVVSYEDALKNFPKLDLTEVFGSASS